jgi:dolichol-phosphate mannosyltransferase
MPGNDLAVVVPVINEVGNVQPLVDELYEHLSDYDWEVVFVDDDSTDGTTASLRRLARRDDRVRLVLRVNQRGLATAALSGMLTTKSRMIVLMDGDGQHDPAVIPSLVAPLAKGDADIVSAARVIAEVDNAALRPQRQGLSTLANKIASALIGHQLKDPMSGFFALTADALEATARKLSDPGFKILLDILANNSALRHSEVPFTFRARSSGESKLDLANLWQFVCFLIHRTVAGFIPVRFISFLLVGATGLVVHFAVLYPMIWATGSFSRSQLLAATLATAWNYMLNNALTFRDRRLKGVAIISGFIKYIAVAAVGVAANVAIATATYSEFGGIIAISAMAGIIVDAVWKYFVSGLLIWRQK